MLPEIRWLERIIDLGGPALHAREVARVQSGEGADLPVHVVSLGSDEPDVPAVGFFGGVHGLERIGSEVVLAYLESVVMRLRWDATLHRQLEGLRLVFMPIVNPGGMLLGTRANPQGVDLMRNSPVEAVERVAAFVGGQRLSPRLPWYRGSAGGPMEAESQALCDVVSAELLGRRFSIAMDCHSGFGLRDRIWFPFAHTRHPLGHLAELHALHEIFRQSYTHHQYVIEPQSTHYLTHGDLWDHLYQEATRRDATAPFLPLTLEMGSWLWIKKNPQQLFSRLGLFNPQLGHRQQRVLRRHLSLLDFLTRAASSHRQWCPDPANRPARHALAVARWYGGRA